MNESQRGKLVFNRSFYIKNYNDIIEQFLLIKFLPLDVDYNSYYDRIILTGLSPNFRKLDPGEIIPIYQVKFNFQFEEKKHE